MVGDGAVGLMGVLAAKQMGAARIIAMSRHKTRQDLALEFGATDIVAERGDAGVARVKALTEGVGADSVLECVGTRESMTQAIHCARPGAMIGYVGVPHGVELDGQFLFFSQRGLLGGPAPVRRFLPHLIDLVLDAQDQSRQGVRPRAAAGRRRRGLPRDGRAARDQDDAAGVAGNFEGEGQCQPGRRTNSGRSPRPTISMSRRSGTTASPMARRPGSGPSVVDSALYARAYHGTASRWHRAALREKAGRITAAGMTKDVAFEPVEGAVNDAIDDAYRKKYQGSP